MEYTTQLDAQKVVAISAIILASLAFSRLTEAQNQTVLLRAPNVEGIAGETVEVMIHIEQGTGLGAFQFTLSWDQHYAKFENAKLAAGVNGLIDSMQNSDGSLRIKAVLAEPFSQTGPLVAIQGHLIDQPLLDTAAKTGRGWIVVDEFRAWSFDPIIELSTESQQGQIALLVAPQRVLLWPWIGMAGIVAMIAFVILAVGHGLKRSRTAKLGQSRDHPA
ncbi:MAG TPA: hypothetical protein PKD64_10890 [Pirellulaceae bacterium]|nr:hypothetical protein [Pirellulaceae bacterium]HMO92688.1 hypothetical protein [Pirellulaceae bacterium]HMP70564.1 hypothetical protein [Pirellulaceae bacterium]